jgi:FkbM family methyltransferase
MRNRILRGVVRSYVRDVPTELGKGRLIQRLLRRLEGHPRRATVELADGLRMELDLGTYIERYVYYTGFYRPWVLPYFDALLARGRTVLDVGASVGAYALWAGRRVGPTGLVLALEPEPSSYAKLERNLALNGMSQVHPLPWAAADRDGATSFHMNAEDHPNQGQSSLAGQDVHARRVEVRCTRIDTLRRERGVRVDVLKVDAQGAERVVLAGAAETLAQDRPAVMVRLHQAKCVAAGGDSTEVQRLLLEAGYDLAVIWPNRSEYDMHAERSTLRPLREPIVVNDGTFIATPPPARSDR